MTIPDLRDPALQDRLRVFLGVHHSENIVFVGGSLVEGFGNSMSDIDVISLGDSIPNNESFPSSQSIGEGHAIEVSTFEGTRVDTEITSQSKVEDLIASVGEGVRHPASISYDDATLMNNIFVGLPIFRVKDASEWRSSLDWASWRDSLLRKCNLLYRGASEDTQGAIDSSNWWLAYYSSLQALDASVDALLIAAGSMSVRGKWRMDYFSKFEMDEIGREYWKLIALSGDSPEEVLQTAKRRLLVAQRWSYDAQLSLGEKLPSR